MRYLKSIILCSLACVGQEAVAQDITGVVVDGQNAAIPYCTITCSEDSSAHSILSYAITKDDGSFSIQSNKSLSSFWLIARCIGYKTLKRHFDKAPTTALHLVMSDEDYNLSEVTVKGTDYGATIKNDTIEFRPDVFKNGSEQNMSDVIKKLPGMTVDESGNVSYQGKKIDKFLVNGQDVLSMGGSALKTLSADFASGVELLNNYNDGNVGNSFNSQETTALNLINKNANNKWAGTFTEGGGVKSKFDSRNSLLKMGQKVSSSILVNANNTSESVFSIMDYINANGGLTGMKSSNGISKLTFSDAERNVLMPSNDEYKRTSGVGNVNLTLKPTTHYSATIGLIHNEMDAKSALSTEQYIKTAQSDTIKSTKERGKKTGNFSSLNLIQKWDVSPSTSLRFLTKLTYSNMRNRATIDDYYANDSNRNSNNDKNKTLNILQRVNLNTLVGKGLLYSNIDFAYSRSDRDLNISSIYDLLDEYKTADNSFYIDRKSKKLDMTGAVGYVFPIFSKINMKWELSGQNTNSRIDQDVESEHLNSRNVGLYGGFMKNKGILRFDAGVRLAYYGNSTNIEGLSTKSAFKWEPSLDMELRFSKQHSIAFGMTYKSEPTDIETLSRLSLINGYDQITNASSYSRMRNSALKMNFAYKLFSLFNRTTFFAYATYEKKNNTDMLNYENNGFVHCQNYMNGGDKESLEATLYFNKGLGKWPIDAKLTATYLWNRNTIAYYSVPYKMTIGNLKTDLGFSSRLKIPFNFEIDGLYNILTNKVSDLNIDADDKEFGCNAKLIYAKDKFSSFITGKWSKAENENGNIILRDVDFSVSYKIKKFTCKLSGSNIFHLNGINWLNQTVTPTYTSYVRYKQHAGNVMFSLTYQL